MGLFENLICTYHYGRCGSTVLSKLLDQLPGIRHLGEFYNENHGVQYAKFDELPRQNAAQNSVESALVALDATLQRWAESNNPPTTIVFEIKHHDFVRRAIAAEPEEFLDALSARGLSRVIHLTRRDVLAWYTSSALANATQVFHTAEEIEERPEITLNLDTLRRDTDLVRAHVARARETFERIGFDVLPLIFEEHIVPDARVAARRIIEWLGAERLAAGMNVPLKRTNPFELEEVIANFADVSHVVPPDRRYLPA